MEDICRVCFIPGDLVSLFESSDSIELSTKMMSLASIEVFPGDGFPSRICGQCAVKLNSSYDFRILCQQSDDRLRGGIDEVGSSLCIKHGSLSSSEERKSEGRNGACGRKPYRILRKPLRIANCHTKELSVLNGSQDVDSDDADSRDADDRLSTSTGEIGESATALKCPSAEDSDGGRSAASCERTDRRGIRIKKCVKSLNGKTGTKTKKTERGKEQCFTCGKVMSSRYRLKMHLRIHTGEKPHACEVCHKRFSLSQSLKVHGRTHTGEKPLACGTCGKTFAQAAGLATHVRLHTGETPYRCGLCPMSFRTTAHRQYHVRKHTGEKSFECSACGRAFITRGDLKQHARIHTGERPYVCTVCGMRMTRSSHLTRHMMTHTGEKPHRCDACGSSYAQRGDLVRHAKRHLARTPPVPRSRNTTVVSDADS